MKKNILLLCCILFSITFATSIDTVIITPQSKEILFRKLIPVVDSTMLKKTVVVGESLLVDINKNGVVDIVEFEGTYNHDAHGLMTYMYIVLINGNTVFLRDTYHSDPGLIKTIVKTYKGKTYFVNIYDYETPREYECKIYRWIKGEMKLQSEFMFSVKYKKLWLK